MVALAPIFEKANTLVDGQKILDLLGVVWPEEIPLAAKYVAAAGSDFFKKPTFVVAKDPVSGKVLGTASYQEELFTEATFGISWVAVHPEHRAKGIGAGVVNTCLDYIRAESVNSPANVILLTYPNQTKLYERCGFKAMGNDAYNGTYMLRYVHR